MSKTISKTSLLEGFPISTAENSGMAALAEITAEELSRLCEDTERIVIFPNLDTMPEDMLDLIANDFSVSWYDFDGSIEEKRNTIRECLSIHRYKGTRYAVETALKSVYDEVQIKEWNEYGGEPYHFKVIIYDSSNDREKRNRVLAKVQYYKNLRSVLEETIFEVGITSDIAIRTAFRPCGKHKRIYSEVKNYAMG